MSLAERVRRRVLRWLLPVPTVVERAEYSLLFSAHDDPAGPSERLLEIALSAASAARTADVGRLRAVLRDVPDYASVWPGEHYKLLAGLMQVLAPKVVVEIGTGAGWSALAMLPHLADDATLATFDVIDWRENPETALTAEDFADPRLTQHLDDLSRAEAVAKHRELLESADFIFVDAAKDGEMERRFLEHFEILRFRQPVVMMFDDIRLWAMLDIWREIRRPKLDLTSFGHWSGTGLVDWNG